MYTVMSMLYSANCNDPNFKLFREIELDSLHLIIIK